MAKVIHKSLFPTYIQYYTDGQGRDLYINANSGGFSKEYQNIKRNSNFILFKQNKYNSLANNTNTFKYYSDGMGRDSYIITDSGGQQRTLKSLKSFHLKDILRQTLFF